MIYQVSALNDEGIDGMVHLSSGKTVPTSHPLNDLPGFNPEELIALAWSTCLNATIQALLAVKKKETLQSQVDVTVQLKKEENGLGYYFQVHATASIQNLSLEEADELVQMAHKRCPVSKLMGQARTLSLETVAYQEKL